MKNIDILKTIMDEYNIDHEVNSNAYSKIPVEDIVKHKLFPNYINNLKALDKSLKRTHIHSKFIYNFESYPYNDWTINIGPEVCCDDHDQMDDVIPFLESKNYRFHEYDESIMLAIVND